MLGIGMGLVASQLGTSANRRSVPPNAARRAGSNGPHSNSDLRWVSR